MSAYFDDGKEDGALRTIGEVSKALDIKTHVLRYWEQQFSMLEPLKRSGGRRYYRPEDVELIATIDRLVNEDGYTLKGAHQAIEAGKAGTGKVKIEADPIAAIRTSPEAEPASQSQVTPEIVDELAPEIEPIAEPASQPEAAIDNSIPLELTTPIADHGGVGEFFGRAPVPSAEMPVEIAATDHALEPLTLTEDQVAIDDRLSRAEIVARLKDIRGRLADALAA